VIDTKGRICSKEWVTGISLKEKYEISSGDCKMKLSLPISDIGYMVLVPEIGDVDINNSTKPQDLTYSSNCVSLQDFYKFIRLNCIIEIEIVESSYSYVNLTFSNPCLWGYEHAISLYLHVNGQSCAGNGYKLGKNYILAFFNENGNLIDTQSIFIGKTGWVGSRGGLHDTYMCSGKIQLEFFQFLNIKCTAQSIKKIIINAANGIW
jgi:hypothetical protein